MNNTLILVLILIRFLNLNTQDKPNPAYTNSARYWLAVGLIQALLSGEKTDQSALDNVVGSKAKKEKKRKILT